MSQPAHPVEREELMAYLDGEVKVERAAALAAHLEQCAECKAVAADLRSVSTQLAEWQVEPAPARLAERLSAALKAHPQHAVTPVKAPTLLRPEPRRPRVRTWVLGIAGTAFAIMLLAAISIPKLLKSRIASNQTREAYLQRATGLSGPSGGIPSSPEAGELPVGPMIIRTASVSLVTKEFDNVRSEMEQILRRHRGYAAQLTVSTHAGMPRSLNATLRVPADQLDAVIAEIQKLGQVVQETQSGEDVTRKYVDLGARLSNARVTEQRLNEILRTRTGRVPDVLNVEREIARVRGEIEQMQAEQKNLERQVQYSELRVSLSEEYKAEFETPAPSTGTRLRNAFIQGYRGLSESVIGLVEFLLGYGPALLFWFAVVFIPARFAWRRLRGAAQ